MLSHWGSLCKDRQLKTTLFTMPCTRESQAVKPTNGHKTTLRLNVCFTYTQIKYLLVFKQCKGSASVIKKT